MPKTLIIAEKPSVATDLAKTLVKAEDVIGKFEKKGQGRNTYFENDIVRIVVFNRIVFTGTKNNNKY